MHNSKCSPNNYFDIHWGRFSWMLPTLLLTADSLLRLALVLIEKAHGAQSSKKISCWGKYFQMKEKTWLKCIIDTDKPDFNCFEHKIWKCSLLAGFWVSHPETILTWRCWALGLGRTISWPVISCWAVHYVLPQWPPCIGPESLPVACLSQLPRAQLPLFHTY